MFQCADEVLKYIASICSLDAMGFYVEINDSGAIKQVIYVHNYRVSFPHKCKYAPTIQTLLTSSLGPNDL